MIIGITILRRHNQDNEVYRVYEPYNVEKLEKLHFVVHFQKTPDI
jgi:hypothetical protein